MYGDSRDPAAQFFKGGDKIFEGVEKGAAKIFGE